MFKIDGPGATGDSRFKESPLPATRVTGEWLNAIQDELVSLITHVDGGDTALAKENSTQVRAAVQTMIARLIDEYDTQAMKYFQWMRVLISDPAGGGVSVVPELEGQLLNAILAMIDRAVADVITIHIATDGEKTFTFAGGLLILKQGYYRETFTSEVTRTVNFQTPFPNDCWSVLTQPILAAASIYKDLWTQVIDPSRSATGFTAQMQADDAYDNGLAGFDWWAIGH